MHLLSICLAIGGRVVVVGVVGRDPALWVRKFNPNPDAATRLIFFPHAGGSASYFYSLSHALSGFYDVVAVQYPGRQERRSEPLVGDVPALADYLAEVLLREADRPTIFFGHSMGASVAYEVALRLESRIELKSLFVSARSSPTRLRTRMVHLLDDAAFLAAIKALSGTDQRLLDDPEVAAMILPVLRNDYRAAETYCSEERPPLTCPISGLIGDQDPQVSAEEVADWARHTSGGFELHRFSGGHFYLADNQDVIVKLLADSV